MTDHFLPYLNIWKENTQNRSGGYTQNLKSKVFASLETNYAIQITARSTVEAIKYLLQNVSKFILTERFYQDPLKEYFGIQRQLRRRNYNQDVAKFGYSDYTIRIQRDVFTSEDMKGKYYKINFRIEVSDETAPKQKIKI